MEEIHAKIFLKIYSGNGSCVHKWKEQQTEASQIFTEYKKNLQEDEYIYKYNNKESISYEEIDQELSAAKPVSEKLEYLKSLKNNQNKNRFVHKFKIK